MYVSVSQALSRAIDQRASWFMCVSVSQALSRATGGPRGLCVSARLRRSVGLLEGLRFPSWEWLLLSTKSHFCSFTYFLLLSSHLKLI